MSLKVVQQNIDYRRPRWGRYVELNNTRTAYVMQIFNTLRLISARTIALEIPWNFLLDWCFCRSQKSSFSRWPSCYARGERWAVQNSWSTSSLSWNSPVKLWLNIKLIVTLFFSTLFNCWELTNNLPQSFR